MCGCKGNVNDDKSSVRVKSRLREFYQSRRPEFFSDSEVRYEVPLTRELFDGSSCMTVGGFPLHKFAWPLFYGLLSRSSGPRNFD